MHEDATSLLEGWTAPNAPQDSLRREFLAVLAAEPRAMWRHGTGVHLTASCLVLDADRSQVLLTLHAKIGIWLPFGGHVEPEDRSVRGAAARETREESGLVGLELGDLVDLDRHALPASQYSACAEHLDLRFVAVDPAGRSAPVVSDESEDVRWWPLDRLPAPIGEDVERLVRAGIAGVIPPRP
ncbi:NUDIX hydrolase [Occultella glacieicola]|uniref:NUDIX hydrolase n=1 Tax=Occultella glacieicola TaxID=2518684 RepID=UPI001F3DE3D6|nr:NUDIX hydrolase [Occultella glacieicola]